MGHTATWCGWNKVTSILWKLGEQGPHSDPTLLSHAAGSLCSGEICRHTEIRKEVASTANTNHFIEDGETINIQHF